MYTNVFRWIRMYIHAYMHAQELYMDVKNVYKCI